MLVIPDEMLRQAGLSEKEALVEIACRLFQAKKLSLPAAGRLSGLGRTEFEDALFVRGIPAYYPTVEELEADLEALRRAGI